MTGFLSAALEAVLGSLFMLIIPGLAWCLLLFEKEKKDVLEMTAMSIAMSISLSTLSVFSLNLLLGTEITLNNAAIILFILTAVPVLILITRGNYLFHLYEKSQFSFLRRK